jgi:protein SDA1
MNFISRLIGCHKLIMTSFYSFLQRYLTSHQQDVTHILAYLIQACHDMVPPEDLLPIVKAIAYNFITERCTNEVSYFFFNTRKQRLLASTNLNLILYYVPTHFSLSLLFLCFCHT